MNIIKFKDIINIDDPIFNKYLKSKYAYWIQCRYVIPMDLITTEEYIKYEQDVNCFVHKPNKGIDKFFWDMHRVDLMRFIDHNETNVLMSPNKYLLSNKFVTDEDITINDIKKFRTWLATTLLYLDRNAKGVNLYKIYDEEQTHLLEYYENKMFDEVTRWIAHIQMKPQITQASSCGCKTPSIEIVNGCVPLDAYRKYMHDKMVDMFGDLGFWIEKDRMFLLVFKQYIDNIIKTNLPLSKVEDVNVLSDCVCQDKTFHTHAVLILKKLSQSIEFICTDEIQEHKNYASEAFKEWADQLYENMYWF